jgi:RHS repeat-associated protein
MRPTSNTRPSNRATRHPKLVARLILIPARCARVSPRRVLTQALSIFLVIAILAVQASAAPQVITGLTAQWRAGVALWLDSSGLSALLSRAQKPPSPGQASQAQRNARVARVTISPGDITIKEGDQVEFAAEAFDAQNAPVGGVRFKWQALDLDRNKQAHMREGRFEARRPGTFRIVAQTGRQQASVTVRVLQDASRHRHEGQQPDLVRPVSSRDDSPTRDDPPKVSSRPEKSPARKRAAAEKDSGAVKFVNASFKRKPAPAAAPAPVALIDENAGWQDGNGYRADDPDNRIGDPPGTPADDGAGSGNYQISAPVVGLAGRAQSIALGLSYNSLLWSKTGTSEVTYDADRGWPAPGWALGFGKIIGLNTQGSLLIEPDGTRRGFTGTVTVYGSSTSFSGKTVDGTFIDYSSSSYQGAINWAQARYPDGTVIDYGAPANGAVFPVQITDANGNYVTVTYRYNRGPDIDTVTDTMGRVLNFHYDTTGYGLLTAITAPDLGTGTRTLVRLQYQQADLGSWANFGFAAGTTARVRDAYPYLLKAIYYPSTNTGYWFGDPDSYSPYGMIAKVVEQRGMSFSASSLDEQGTLTPGTTSQQLGHDYPTSLGSLTDAPTYTTATLSWAYSDAGDSVTNYFVQKNATNPNDPNTPSSKTEVTLPGGTKNVQYSYRLPGDFKDGLVYEDDTFDSNGNLLGTSKVTWEQGDYNSPRPTRTDVTDERGQTLRTEYTYAAAKYNQAVEIRSYDYDGATLLKRTVTSYQNSPNYTARHIFNLPTSVDLYGADGARASRTEYEYDNATLADAPGVTMHLDTHNPYAPWYEVECDCDWEYNQWGYEEWVCHSTCPQTDYDPSTNYRGLVTKVTSYTDAAPDPAAGPVSETFTYDMTGNQLTATASCCEQTSTVYTVDTQYAYPESQTRGSSDPNSPDRITTTATHDFNTGLDLTATDANGRTTQAVYYQTSLRPQYHNMPTGARTTFEYDDAQMTVTETTTLSAGGAVADQSVTYLNGLGLVRRVEALGGYNAWDVVETKYDTLGRVWKKSLPYRSGSEQPQWGENFYDALGRVVRTVAPDGSEAKTFYNEASRPDAATPGSPAGQTTRSVNAWGQERWGRMDAQGRLVEVVEPNPSGDGTVAAGGLLTTYAYNALDNLVQVNQGAQQRRFGYDSLGRLTRQKLAEASATLDDSGQYVGAGGPGAQWSAAFAYDTRSNLVARTDARGVTTSYAYNSDPLNRLQSVSYTVGAQHDTSSPIAAAATVTYEYMGSGDKTRPYRVTTANVRQDTLSYDAEGRLHDLTSAITSRPGQPMSVTYDYDALDRVTDITYPAQYQLNVPNPSRRVVHQDYDVASRVSSLLVNGNSYASELVYNAASQATQLKVGYGSYFTRELYDYDPTTNLLRNQWVMNDGTTPILSLGYEYLRPGTTSGRTGQVTKITNGLNAQKGRTYTYDALGRLKQAAGGDPSAAPLWTQTYGYDRYGNRQTVASSGNTAELKVPKDPAAKLPDVEIAANSAPPLPEPLRGNASRTTTDAPDKSRLYGLAPANMLSSALVLDTPTNLQVTSAADTQISLTWSSASGTNFRVERSPGLTGTYALVGTSATTGFNDNTVSRGNAYLYRVCSADAGGQCVSGYSSFALGTAVTFADPQLTAQATTIKAQHFSDLRLAVNAVRRAAGLADATWTDLTLTPQSTTVRAVHVQELRDRLNEALAALNITVSPFTDPVLATGSGGTLIKKTHVEELRARATRGQTNSAGGAGPVPTDGHASLAYDAASNRINTPGWQYDAAGNQTRTQVSDGGPWQRMEYDAANRLVAVKTDAGALVASYTYADTNDRMISQEGGTRTYYAWGAAGVVAEYVEVDGTASAASPQWSKSYVYLGERLLATQQPNGAGGDYVEYHHPDRLGARVVTNNTNATFYEQASLPYGVALDAESSGVTSRRFTSYDRSLATGLDYAVNRHYDSAQGRFTQVDPLGMGASNLLDPQSLNLYSYCGNDPVNRVDPDGLFWGKLFHFLKKVFKWLAVAAAVAVAVLTIVYAGPLIAQMGLYKAILGIIGAVANAASSVLKALGLKTAAAVFGVIAAGASFLTSLDKIAGAGWEKAKSIFKAISDGASLASKTLSLAGQTKLSQVFGLIGSATGFISTVIRQPEDPTTHQPIPNSKYGFHPKLWETLKFARSAAQQIATIAGAKKVADWLDTLGLVEDVYTLYQGIFHFNKEDMKLNKPIKGVTDPAALVALNRQLRTLQRLTRISGLIGKVNSAIGRVEKGVALAR